MVTRKHYLVIAAMVLAIGAAVPTFAATVSYNSIPATYGPLVVPFAGSPTLDIPKWNPSLFPGMTLTAIDLELTGTLAGSQGYVLSEGTNIDITLNTTATLKLSYLSTDLVVAIPTQTDVFTGITAESNDSATLSNFATNSESLAASYFPTFTGSGNVVVDLKSMVLYGDGGTGGTVAFLHSPQAQADGKVTYTYSENIPEPGTLALMGFGLLGLIGFVRRRRDAE